MHSLKAILAGRVFTGENWLDDHAVITEAGIIKDLVAVTALPSDIPRESYPDHLLVPAYMDLQIYGAHGKLLAVYPEPDALVKLNDYCRAGGAPLCMPTVATNAYEVFYAAIDAIRAYWQEGGEGIMGLHIEGPWLNPVKRGAHIEAFIHSPTVEQVRELLDYGKGVIRIITLAPEVVSPEIITLIRSYGIIISAGHSNATYVQAKTGFANGITAVTHLYNAMSPLLHREPGLAGATMDDDTVMASIIPDGYHVDYAAVRIAKAVMKERIFVITDAVTDTDQGEYPHQRNGDKYESGGILSGSALTMQSAMLNLVRQVNIEPGEAIRMCSLYPARVMGLDDQYGKIQQGYKASMLLLDQQLELIKLL
jgi:N-acetylglucosamine-6-phosphate deacetylase